MFMGMSELEDRVVELDEENEQLKKELVIARIANNITCFLYKGHWIKCKRVMGNNYNIIDYQKILTDNFLNVKCVVCGEFITCKNTCETERDY